MAGKIDALKSKVVKKKKVISGGRNLAIMGVLSIVLALTTTGISLAVYHNSGDIYLDRSRPGFLPDEEEISEDEKTEEEYDFSKDGNLSREGLKEYLENLDVMVKAIDSYEKPFGPEILSDEHLGIVEKTVPDGVGEKMVDEVVETDEALQQ